MSTIDWLVMGITLFIIVVYGMWKSRKTRNIQGFLLADRKLALVPCRSFCNGNTGKCHYIFISTRTGLQRWHEVPAVLFRSSAGMIVLCITFIPIFRRLNVYTAYEYLEKRFDAKTRLLTAFLFLLQRGISTGITFMRLQ